MGNLRIRLEKDVELKLATGAATQHQRKTDANFDDEITQYLYRDLDEIHGEDLAALDINSGRVQGLAFYKDILDYCGLGEPKSWDDLKKYIKPDIVDNIILKNIYKSLTHLELYVGGILETLLPGTITVPTFNCLMVDQFKRIKDCDRYWYKNQYQPYPFTASGCFPARSE